MKTKTILECLKNENKSLNLRKFENLLKIGLISWKKDKLKLNPNYYRANRLKEILDEIYKFTSFLDKKENVIFKERLYCYLFDIEEMVMCDNCKINPAKFNGHLQEGYYSYCYQSCANSVSISKRWNEMLEEKKNEFFKNLVKTRKENGSYKWSEETKEKMRQAALKDEVKAKKKKTNLERYGVENPGILGGNSSKAAFFYINEFIKQNKIDVDKCFYKDTNIDEYYKMLKHPLKKKFYTQYDLVVFKTIEDKKNKNDNSIAMVLEYNRPFHYRFIDVIKRPFDKATFYKNSNYIIESFIDDCVKLLYMLEKTENVYVYLEKDDFIEKLFKKKVEEELNYVLDLYKEKK